MSPDGIALFERIRYRRHDGSVFMYVFDLIELNGDDLRREPLEGRPPPPISSRRRVSPFCSNDADVALLSRARARGPALKNLSRLKVEWGPIWSPAH